MRAHKVTRPTNLVALRQRAGIRSQVQLARILGVHRSVVGLWETGERKVPANHLQALAEALNVPAMELWTALDIPKPTGRPPKSKGLNPELRLWHLEENEWLREHEGQLPLPELTESFNKHFLDLQNRVGRPPRSLGAVKRELVKLGLTTECRVGFSLLELARIVGWCPPSDNTASPALDKHWIRPGLLKCNFVHGHGSARKMFGKRFQILESDFEDFLQNHPYAYAWRKFQPGPWRQRAEILSKRSPWRNAKDVAREVGVSRFSLRKYVIAARIETKRRHHTIGGMPSRCGEMMIKIDDIPTLREMARQSRARQLANVLNRNVRLRVAA